jgi:predicted dehydrogenase
MSSNKSNILITGAGQLGSRYLQGLSKCQNPLRITVQDISSESLAQAELRWQEAGGPSTHHEVSFHTELKQCPQQLDMAIIATTAHSRPEVVKNVAQHSNVRYWVLEKVLAQNSQGLDEIQSHVGNASVAWVNTPRRMIPWHSLIKERLLSQSPLHLTVIGGPWGLACNAVHFLDLMAWWSRESLVAVSCDQLEDSWFKAKRVGNWEVFGALTATFSGGATATLISSSSGDPSYFIKLIDASGSWRIDEAKGTAIYTDGLEIRGRLPYQSEMTTTLVDEILDTGCCQLPTLEESIAIHRVFVKAILGHWQRHIDPAATFVPIT